MRATSCNHYINLVKKLPLNSNKKTGIAIAYVPVCDFTDMLTSHLDSETLMVLDENYQCSRDIVIHEISGIIFQINPLSLELMLFQR